MVQYLIIGDSHIPRRAKDVSVEIYDKITELTSTELFEFTFFTGDEINAPKFMEFLNLKTKREVLIVIGNMDYFDGNRDAPLYQEMGIPLNDYTLKVGLTHGAQIEPRGDHNQLELLASERNYHILISGHTHHEEVFLTRKNILLLNPGSVTGAWSFVASQIPCFIIMSTEEKTKNITINLFQFDKKSKLFNEKRSYFIFQDDRVQQKY